MYNNLFNKILFVCLFGVFFLGGVFAEESLNLNYLFFHLSDDVSKDNQISYEVRNGDILSDDLLFKLELLKDDKKLDICEKKINFEEDDIYKKISCLISNGGGSGSYVFVAKLISGDEVLEEIINLEYLDRDSEIVVSMDFVDVSDDKTEIVLNVDGVGENLQILQQIPKEVIELLSDENKADLISSDLEYVILDEDPLIAWNVEKAPAKINYTINKKISIENKQKFSVEVDGSSSVFKSVIVILIIFIVILIFRPIFMKK